MHIKGPLADTPFVMPAWQRRITRQIFGWKRRDGSRRYRYVYIELPRGNGKSTWAAGIALYMLVADTEPSVEVYGAATDDRTATIVFDVAAEMAAKSPTLRDEVTPEKRYLRSDNGYYRVLTSKAATKHGLSPTCIIFDELHAQANRALFDVLKTAMGKRAQPLMIMITTAGDDQESICWQQHDYARKILDGVLVDDAFLPVIFAADPKDDWTQPETWRTANPNYGISVQQSFLEDECKQALAQPSYQNTFLQLYLNIWTQQAERWMPMAEWNACGTREIPDLTGRVCYGGMDLSSTTDLSALVLAFPPVMPDEPIWLLCWFWMPAARLKRREEKDQANYTAWVNEGLIETTPGNVIDYEAIRARLGVLAEQYHIVDIGYDPWNATQLVLQLEQDGHTMVKTRQMPGVLNAPSKELMRLVLSGGVGHGGNKALRWMADNVAVKRDASDNVMPDKAKSTGRIDGILGAVMAIDRLTRHENEKRKTSVYNKRPMRFLGR